MPVADDADTLVDALVGYGLTGPLSGTAAELDNDLLLADIGLPAGVYDRLDIPAFRFADYVVALTAPSPPGNSTVR